MPTHKVRAKQKIKENTKNRNFFFSNRDEQGLLWKTVQEDVRNPETPKVIKDYLTNLLDKVNANELEDA